jgi:hypothetical protein
MDMWGLVVEVLGAVAVGLLLIALGWAAIERGSIHHRLTRLRRDPGRSAAGLFRFARHGRRIHLALGAVAGWV